MEALPSTEDLLRVMTILGIPGDPLYIMKDHTDERRRAELLAYVAAAVLGRLRAAEDLAGLDVDERAALHRRADRAVAGPGGRAADLQEARLAWVHHAAVPERGTGADPVADTVVTTVGVLIQLLADRGGSPMLGDALLGLRDAADHLGVVLRTAPCEPV